MASARHRSWSYSRQAAFDRCPREFFFTYYPWDEPDTEEARFLARVTTPELSAGLAVHYAIGMALRSFQSSGVTVRGLSKPALEQFNRDVSTSKWIVKQMLAGRKPPLEGPVFHHDLYGYSGTSSIEAAKDRLKECLVNFEESDLWRYVRGTDTSGWQDVDLPMEDADHFFLRGKLAKDTRIYSSYDFALFDQDILHILDWKTETHTPTAEARAERQLVGYALRFSNYGAVEREIGDIRIQAAWLQEPPTWNPKVISPSVVSDVISTIRSQIEVEERRTKRGVDGSGKKAWITRKSWFPPKPTYRKCVRCKFAKICEEGKAIVLSDKAPTPSA